MAELVFLTLIYWIMIYLVDSAIRQKKENRHHSFTAPTKREIRQFSRRVVVRWRQRNVQETVQRCCFFRHKAFNFC